ncbi:MAG: hypothetical protein M3301_00835 [Chloroflexota bacterium]|nr:hypothetical protein [Chloroflexota bacterium]
MEVDRQQVLTDYVRCLDTRVASRKLTLWITALRRPPLGPYATRRSRFMVIATRQQYSTPRPRLAECQGRLAEFLSSVALEDLDAHAREDLPPADWEYLREMLREPVAHASAAALDVLENELEQALEGTPPALLARLETLRARADLGCD